MELIKQPKKYKPFLSNNSEYCDLVPSVSDFDETDGILCCCGSKTIFLHSNAFRSHIKTQKHKTWITTLNQNKQNYYVENELLRETIQNQKIIIGRQERTIQSYIQTISHLTEQTIQQITAIPSISLIDV
jgi:uncharacterized protein (UPF0333 family)